MSIQLFKNNEINDDFSRNMLEDIMNKKFNKNENNLIRKKIFTSYKSNNSLNDIDSEVDDEIKENIIQRNLFYCSTKKDSTYGELKKFYDGEIKFDEISKDIVDNMSYSDSYTSSCSGDTWHERLYEDYDYLSEISDIPSHFSDMSGDLLHEYLHERYYKAKDLIQKMRKKSIIYSFINSLGKYTKKDYEFIKQYKHNLNQEIIKKYAK